MAVAVDQYARDGAHVSFILPQSLIKSALNHRAFRRFSLRDHWVDYHVDEVEDLVAVRPFEGVANRTIIIHATRGEPTAYPVPYRRWVHIKDGSYDLHLPRSSKKSVNHRTRATSLAIGRLVRQQLLKPFEVFRVNLSIAHEPGSSLVVQMLYIISIFVSYRQNSSR